MKKMGYVIGLVIGIPIFIVVVNFFFFRGNDPDLKEISQYIQNSKKDTIILPQNSTVKSEQFIKGLSRSGRPSGFLRGYKFLDAKYKKYFSLMTFVWFDKNAEMRTAVLRQNEDGDKISVRINKDQLKNPQYGTKENPIPVFPIDILNLKGGYPEDPFHVSDELNKIFVEQYLKHFMPEEEFKEMFEK